MTKAEILAYFQDINEAYNNANKHDDLRRMLDELTQPKTGWWKFVGGQIFTCSECGHITDIFSDYCPGCGTRMTQATPTPKKGKWIIMTIRGEKRPCCSKCGEGTGTIYEYRFCPNCGAKMVEPQESEDKE